jgi:hypothetical protein
MSKVNFKGTSKEAPVKLPTNIPQYFFDDTYIAHHERISREWMETRVFPEPSIKAENPWDSRVVCLFGTVFSIPGEGYRMYYSSMTNGRDQDVLVAVSKDGYSWKRPDLGLVDWEGRKNNNISFAPERHMDSPSIIYEKEDPQYPYKMITFENSSKGKWGEASDFGLYVYGSPDGLTWEPLSPEVRLKAGDRTNVMPTKPDGKYVIYTRNWDMMKTEGKRVIYRSESENFLDWSEPVVVLEPDLEDPPDVEFYGMSVFERHGWFFGLLEYWHSATDTLETHLAISRDGKKWMRPNKRKPFIAPTYDWNLKWSSCASNGPMIINDEMIFYFGGRWVGHNRRNSEEHGVIGQASLPIDQFCALEASAEGEFITVPIMWPGGELELNADTRQSFVSHQGHINGQIKVEVLDADGQPMNGWCGDQCATFQGNTHGMRKLNSGEVQWANGKKMNDLKGQVIRIRFMMKHARLFTFEAKSE